jgi:type VI secretion system secreted protein VgrG
VESDPIGLAGGSYSTYGYAGGNPLSNRDPAGLYFGIDDAIAVGLGAVVGIASQGLSDVISGQVGSWQDYAGSAIGGAAAGEASLYLGPLATGAVFGGATNFAKQILNLSTGKQCHFSATSLGIDTGLGAALGRLAGPTIRGITAGRGSYGSIFNQIVTKQANGTIGNISVSTAAKMATYQQASGLTGTSVGSIASAVENAVTGGEPCGCQ